MRYAGNAGMQKNTRPEKSSAPSKGKGTNSLSLMCSYVIARQEPRHLIKLFNENGHLPFSHKESLPEYLQRNCVQLVREQGNEGIVKILSVHPDKELILEHFAPKAQPVPTPLPTPLPVKEDQTTENFTGKESPVYKVAPETLAQRAADLGQQPSKPAEDLVAIFLILCLVVVIISAIE